MHFKTDTATQWPLFQDNLGKPAPELYLNFNEASWTICKSFAPHCRQTATPAPHHSISFTGQMRFLMPNQQCQSTEGKFNTF